MNCRRERYANLQLLSVYGSDSCESSLVIDTLKQGSLFTARTTSSDIRVSAYNHFDRYLNTPSKDEPYKKHVKNNIIITIRKI